MCPVWTNLPGVHCQQTHVLSQQPSNSASVIATIRSTCVTFSQLWPSLMWSMISKNWLLACLWEPRTWELPSLSSVERCLFLLYWPFLVFHAPSPDLPLVKLENDLSFPSILSPMPITPATTSLAKCRNKGNLIATPLRLSVLRLFVASDVWTQHVHLHGGYILESHSHPQPGTLDGNHSLTSESWN